MVKTTAMAHGSSSFALLLLVEIVLLLFFANRAQAFPLSNHQIHVLVENRGSSSFTVRYAQSNDDDDAETERPVATTTTTTTQLVLRKVLDYMRDSPFVAQKHAEHVSSPTVAHLFQGTPLADAPDEKKAEFADSWAGRALAFVMAEEQDYLGEWKVRKIIEAAGDHDEKEAAASVTRRSTSHRVVVYSFVDCPWCVLAKNVLRENYDPASFRVIELETLGRNGKGVRAELAKRTGRTSMPCVFVDGVPIGGFTDGEPCGPGLKVLHESGELVALMANERTDVRT